jgi:hypothetical protein
MKRFVYLVAAHHMPEQLDRLIRTLLHGSPDARVVLHLDPSKRFLDPRRFVAIPGVRLIPNPVAVQWGRYTQVELVRHSLDWISKHIPFDWVVYLSGQDYPLRAPAEIEQFYRDNHHDGFLSAVPIDAGIPCDSVACDLADPSTDMKRCLDCYQRYHYRFYSIRAIEAAADKLPGLRQIYRRIERRLHASDGRLCMRQWPDPHGPRNLLGVRETQMFSQDFLSHKGFAWFSFNHHAVCRLLEEFRRHPKAIRHFQRTLVPDESVIQTLLANVDDVSISREPRRFMIWENAGAANPQILTMRNFQAAITSGMDFGRKFDMKQDPEIFDQIDKHVGIQPKYTANL